MTQAYKEIDKSDILQKAMSIIGLAKHEILATMDLAEEVKKPLPLEYFSLLRRKIETGVKVTRLAFGSIADFRIFSQKHNITDENYECILVKSRNYKRMLLIDGKKLLFAVDDDGKRRFFYSTDPERIKEYFQYFDKILKRLSFLKKKKPME